MARKPVVSNDLNVLVGLAAAAIHAPQPQLPMNKKKYRVYFNFLKRCTAPNIFALAKAHATALENMAALAQHLERLGCRCGPMPTVPGLGQVARIHHADICPVQVRAHPVFQGFESTAQGDGPMHTRIEPGETDAATGVTNNGKTPLYIGDILSPMAIEPGRGQIPDSVAKP